MADEYKPPAGHTKHLSDSERAHNGEPGSQVRHGADATKFRYKTVGDKLKSAGFDTDKIGAAMDRNNGS